jgi:hypothetical protein
MTNKTISINPSLFAVGGAKTKKNRGEKKQKPTMAPLISPNVLKNKLLKRIKEHKQRETENLENVGGGENNGSTHLSNKAADMIVSDEFMESIEYLKTLSDERKKRSSIEKRRSDLERNTVKHYQALNNSESSHQQVNIELPEELSEPLIKINTANLSAAGGGESIALSPYKNDIVPYGVLKGGLKPTFKDWNKTLRSNIVTDSNLALTIQGNPLISEKSARENRLANLRTKLKQKQVVGAPAKSVGGAVETIAVPAPSIASLVPTSVVVVNSPPVKNATNEGTIATKRTTTRTIKRKYTLGRSKIQKTVAVLIKDRSTRRQVLHAQKDLKRKSINDVKAYLREHNLIKVGSTTPNDIMRKMYESAMLAGEIKNSNVDTLLHNFSKEEREL